MEKQIALVNNPEYLQQQVWPLIVELADITKSPNISAHSLMAYFLYGINCGVELWGALQDNKCIGFVSFYMATAPYYSTGVMSSIYMKEKDEELVAQLYDKFPEFLKKNNLKYCMYHSPNKKLGEHIKHKLSERGIQTIKMGYLQTGKREIRGGK